MALVDNYVKKLSETDLIQGERAERDKAALLEEMGLEDRSVRKLQQTMMSPAEAIAAKSEELTHIRQHKSQRDQWEEFIDAKRRMGRVLHHSDFFRLLRVALPGVVIYQGAQHNRVGLMITRNTPADEIDGYRGTFRWVDAATYIGWSELGWIPEYEIDVVNDVDVAVGQKRGWRTILLNLIARVDEFKRCASIITEETARRIFGEPTNGATASFYRRRLWEFRNRRGSFSDMNLQQAIVATQAKATYGKGKFTKGRRSVTAA